MGVRDDWLHGRLVIMHSVSGFLVCVLIVISESSFTPNMTSHDIRLGFWESSPDLVSIASISLGLDRVQEEGIAPDLNFSIAYRVGVSTPLKGMTAAMELIQQEKVDVLLGMFNSKVCIPTGHLLSYFNTPLFPSSCTDPALEDKGSFPTVIRTIPTYDKIKRAFFMLFVEYGWKKAAIYSMKIRFCDMAARAINEGFGENNITITDWEQLDWILTEAEIRESLLKIKQRARIIVICHIGDRIRQSMLVAEELGMTGSDYVFIYPGLLPMASTQKPWIDSHNATTQEQTAEQKALFRNFKQVTVADMPYEYQLAYSDRIVQRFAEPPWNFSFNGYNSNSLKYMMFVVDSVYLYVTVIKEILAEGGDHRDGRLILEKSKNRQFNGVTGRVALDDHADRVPDYSLWHCPPYQDECSTYATIAIAPPSSMKHEVEPYWGTENNKPPPDTPPCGFRGEFCLPNDYKTAKIAGTICGTAFILITAAIIIHVKRQESREKKLQMMTWKVAFDEIEFTKKAVGSMLAMSVRSMKSAMSEASTVDVGNLKTQLYTKVGVYNGSMVAVKNISKQSITLSRQLLVELKTMKDLTHENINPFKGACIDPGKICVLFSYCTRGSVLDILENDEIKLDWLFKSSMMTDLVNGMIYLHGSKLRSHGNLKSSNCLIDSRWVLKISDFGLAKVKEGERDSDFGEYRVNQQMLWTAPELLRLEKSRPLYGTQKGDVYSFSIILQEIAYRASPFFGSQPPQETVELVKQTSDPPYRPTPLEDDKVKEVKTEMVILMHRCWDEEPAARPTFTEVKKILRKLNKGKQINIMDNMICMLEKYASNLEGLVQQRTQELVEEKKKTDMLLYRMLPLLIAEKLKHGQDVEPEMFESVTIYFSDIVGFTSLSSGSTPMQVVNLLNDLYTTFDRTIERYDVYKVETIGDAYMVVSGLPRRNGDRHATEIADMALALLAKVCTFKIAHRPEMVLQLRIGLHTGPSAAGVVGLTMPRYCLFGDTVNMASRMESTGQAQKIHISEAAKQALEAFNAYNIELRGATEVKGKGKQNTYWLCHKVSQSTARINQELPNAVYGDIQGDLEMQMHQIPVIP